MPNILPLIEPGSPEGQFKGLRSAVAKSLLGAGEFAAFQNLRSSTGVPTVRGGTQLFLSIPTALDGATIVDMWTGELNATSYIVVVFALGSTYEVWASTAGAALYRISEVGGWHGGATGDTRFTALTGRITFAVVPHTRRYFAGATYPSRDILLISNGQDYIRIWDPGRATNETLSITGATNASPIRITTGTNHNLNDGDTCPLISGVLGNTAANGSFWIDRQSATTFDLYHDEALSKPVAGNGTYVSGGTISLDSRFSVHQPVTVPTDATLFTQKATFGSFWQVRTSSGKTYLSSGVVNQARFNLSNGPYDVYTGANACIVLTWQTTAAAGDIAAVYFAAAALNLGKGLVLFTEDVTTDFGADMILGHCKIEFGVEDVAYGSVSTWVTLYDPTSTNDMERRVESSLLGGPETDPARRMFFFPCEQIAVASRTGYHLRFTRKTTAPTPAVNAQIVLLAICGGGAFQGGTEFSLSYEDEPGHSETYGIVAGGGPTSDAEPVALDGGALGGGLGGGSGSSGSGSSAGASAGGAA